jgi:choline dehydrogenase-like flavoprotein
MSTVLIVGSGATGVHLAETLLTAHHSVTMLDVGHERPQPVLPEADFDGLKDGLDDPVGYFLGAGGEAVVFPTERPKYYSFPPSKEYVFKSPPNFATAPSDFEPAISFAAGGLAEAWTAGCYPLNDAELADFPFDSRALLPHYTEVIRRIGVGASRDDLSRFSAWFEDYMDPLELDPHSAQLLANYAKRRADLNRHFRFYLGRSRVAVLSRDLGERRACANRGRCLWGCARQSLYAPSSTLQQLRRNPRFRYIPEAYVTHFTYEDGLVTGVVTSTADGQSRRFSADAYALAAGTLCSSKILLDSIFRRSGQVHELTGLMDNRQIMMPFLSLGMLGRPMRTHAYQFHQLALGIEQPRPEEYVHGQITSLKAAAVHPIAQSLPLDLRSALTVFRMTHAALGVANVWLHDRRADGNRITIRPQDGNGRTEMVVRYSANNDDRLSAVMNLLKRVLRKLGCLVPPGMTRVLPGGSSVHYAGTVPMQLRRGRFTCAPDCRSHDFGNLYFADGATFPFLPAKNLTFTLMANAIRVGDAINQELRA